MNGNDPSMMGIKDPGKRIRKLEDHRLNLWLIILQIQDQIGCIEHEIQICKGERPIKYCDPCERTEPECGACKGIDEREDAEGLK